MNETSEPFRNERTSFSSPDWIRSASCVRMTASRYSLVGSSSWSNRSALKISSYFCSSQLNFSARVDVASDEKSSSLRYKLATRLISCRTLSLWKRGSFETPALMSCFRRSEAVFGTEFLTVKKLSKNSLRLACNSSPTFSLINLAICCLVSSVAFFISIEASMFLT